MFEQEILSPVAAALKLLESNDSATQAASRKLIIKALRNLENDPSNEKFKRLKTSNKVVAAKIMNVRGATQLMACAGFFQKGDFLEASGDGLAAKAKAVADALEAGDGSYRVKALLHHNACVRGVAVDGAGFLATGALDNVVRLWDSSGLLVHELRGHEKPRAADGGVLAVALMEGGGRVLSGARDGRLLAFLRDASAANCYVGHGEPIEGQPKLTNAQNVSCVCCEGDLVLTGSWDRTIIKWDVNGDAPGVRYGPFGQVINGMALLEGGAKCAAAIGDGSVACFDPRLPPGPVLWEATDAKGVVLRNCCAAAGCVGTVSNDAMVRLWAADTGALLRGAKTGLDGYLLAVAGSADAIYAAGDDGIVTKFLAPSLAVALRIPQPAAVWSLAVRGSELLVGLDDHHGAVLWTCNPAAALEGPVATSIVSSCHEAAAKAALIVAPAVLEGAAAAAPAGAGGAGGEVSMGGSEAPPPDPNFDFSFPVELTGRPGLQINWNRGDDPNMVAINFCDQNGIPRNQLGDVVVFVQNAMGQMEGAAPAAPAAPAASTLTDAQKAEMVQQVVAMGVDVTQAFNALEQTNYQSVEAALNSIFG